MEWVLISVVFILSLAAGQRDIEGPSFTWGAFFRKVALSLILLALGFLFLIVARG